MGIHLKVFMVFGAILEHLIIISVKLKTINSVLQVLVLLILEIIIFLLALNTSNALIEGGPQEHQQVAVPTGRSVFGLLHDN